MKHLQVPDPAVPEGSTAVEELLHLEFNISISWFSNSQLFSPSAVPSEALAGEDAVTAGVAPRDVVVATAKRAAAPRQGLNLLQRLRTPPVPHGQP